MLAQLCLIVFPLLLIVAAISDLATMKIPNRISLLLVGGFVVAALLAGLPAQQILTSIAGAVIVFAAGFACFAFGWMGGGDVKLAAAAALWLGLGHHLDYLLLAAIGGGLLTLALLVIRRIPLPATALRWDWAARLHDRKTGIPYGVALAGAALLVYPATPLWQAVH
jgi:prepilin peptidase CpaA